MEKLNVLHIMSGFGGGISSFIRNKAQEMPQYNIRFDVVTYDECPKDFSEVIHSTGGKIYKMVNPKTNGWKNFINTFTVPLKENHYDIIHCHITGIRLSPYYLLAKKYSKAHFFLHAHSSTIIESLNSSEKIQLKIDQMVNSFASESPLGCGQKAINSVYGPSVSKDEMMVIPNSININEFIFQNYTERCINRKKQREKLGLTDDELIVGHIGRLMKVKNHELTLQLAKQMKEQQFNGKILIIGEGDRNEELREMVNTEKLNDYIIFTGRISPISEFYPALDCVLLPSFSEGLPTVVVESQIAGVPVVMSDTITKEVDLELNMIKTVSVNADITEWFKAIMLIQKNEIPNPEVRKSVAEEKKFSNEKSAELYVNFLRGNIKNYTIL